VGLLSRDLPVSWDWAVDNRQCLHALGLDGSRPRTFFGVPTEAAFSQRWNARCKLDDRLLRPSGPTERRRDADTAGGMALAQAIRVGLRDFNCAKVEVSQAGSLAQQREVTIIEGPPASGINCPRP
jgi:hypothetical protein